jgi:ATP/ADP translocase
MTGMLWVIGAATVTFVGVIAYAMTRRYGWGLAVMLPILALVTMIGMRWQADGLSLDEGLRALGPMVVYASPVLLGVAIGVALGRLKRG